MNTTIKFITILTIILTLSGCNLFNPDTTTHNVTLIVNQSYDINLGQSGDEQGASIVVAPLNAAVSETYRDTVNYEVHYRYVPNLNYTGTDHVKLSLISADLVDQNGTIISGYVEINFTIIGLED